MVSECGDWRRVGGDADDRCVELAAAAAREPSVPGPLPTLQPTDPRAFHSTLGEIAASPQNGVLTPSGTCIVPGSDGVQSALSRKETRPSIQDDEY